MILGLIVGRVVASVRADGLDAPVYYLVDACKPDGSRKGSYHVALDLVGAGPGEMVMLSQGSSARMTMRTENRPVDAVIIGIIDMIDRAGGSLYRKQVDVWN